MDDCAKYCIALSLTDTSVNGATMSSTNWCYCERTMVALDTAETKYKACLFNETGKPYIYFF